MRQNLKERRLKSMNKLNIDESNILCLKDRHGIEAEKLKEGIIYSCNISLARYCQATNELEVIYSLTQEESEKPHYVLNRMKVDSEEFNLLLEHIYPVHYDIFAVNLEDFLHFFAYCEVKFIDGCPMIIICDLNQSPMSDLAVALYRSN